MQKFLFSLMQIPLIDFTLHLLLDFTTSNYLLAMRDKYKIFAFIHEKYDFLKNL